MILWYTYKKDYVSEVVMRTGAIYIIKNDINEKVYIGQTTMTVHERFMTHMKPSTVKQRSGYKLYMAVKKYGKEHFYVETLESNIPLEELDTKEIQYIAQYDSYYNGYNSTKGGDGRIINLIENENELLEKAKHGVPATELAKYYGVNKATIYRTLHKLNFYYYEVDEESVVDAAMSGMKQADIAILFGIDKMTVQRVLRRKDIRFHKQRVDMREEFSAEAIRRDYDAQLSIEDICKKHNITHTTFYRIKKQYSFPTRKQLYTNVTQRNDIELMKKDYFNGLKTQELCAKYHLSAGSLYRIIETYKWGKRRK